MRKLLVFAMAVLAAGCASVATWSNSDPSLARFLQNRRTHCDSLPRVYSGFLFDYCWLDSEPQRIYGSAPMVLLIADGLLSGIADTLALPVTLVQQRRRGDIPLHSHPPAAPAETGGATTDTAPSDDIMPAEPQP